MNKSSIALKVLPVLIMVIAISSFMYMKSTRPERKQAEPTEKVWQVYAMAAQPENRAPSIILYGNVETPELFRASAPAAGIVESVSVRPGQLISVGQPMVRLDQRDFEATLLQAEADVLDIQAQLDEIKLRHQANQQTLQQEQELLQLAKQEVQRVKRLMSNNLSSESALSAASEALGRQQLSVISRQLEVDRYPSLRAQFQARLKRARARVSETRLSLERSEVISQVEAVVAEVPVTSGDSVRSNDLLVSLYSLDSLEVRARIPSRFQTEVARQLEQGQTLTAIASSDAGEVQMNLLRLAGEADPSGIDAYFEIARGASRLRLGNLLKIELFRPIQQDVIAVPFRAIYGNNRIYVFDDGVMKSITVESLGQVEDDQGEKQMLVRSSQLKAGDRIITTHLPNAVDGLKVRIVQQG